VSLVGYTFPFDDPNGDKQWQYVVVRIDGMDCTFSNDSLLDRSFAVLPRTGAPNKILPVVYSPPTPIQKLSKFRISLTDFKGDRAIFVGTQEWSLHFDIEYDDKGVVEAEELDALPGGERDDVETFEPQGVPSGQRKLRRRQQAAAIDPDDAQQYNAFGGMAELARLLQEGTRSMT
jgi:hypothetical protein